MDETEKARIFNELADLNDRPGDSIWIKAYLKAIGIPETDAIRLVEKCQPTAGEIAKLCVKYYDSDEYKQRYR